MAKKKPASTRKKIFALVFWEGVRDDAQAAADEDFGGNVTTLVNTAVKSYLKVRKRGK